MKALSLQRHDSPLNVRRPHPAGPLSATLFAAVMSLGLATACPPTPPDEGEGEEGEGEAGEGEGEEGEGEAGEGEGEGEEPPPPFAISTKNRLAWKRHRAVESDVLAALALDKGELCNELGLYSCVDFVHTVALGGNEPFVKSQYEPLPSPTVTTPVAFERVALSGCIAAADRDAAADPVVFVDLDFGAAVDATAAEATAQTLGGRLLGRELLPEEAAAFADLAVDDDGNAVSTRDFAVLSCFAIATLSENLFY